MYYGKAFDLKSQQALLFTLQVSRYCLSEFQGRIAILVPLIALIVFHDTTCVQAHLNVYYRRHWSKILQSLGLLQVFKLACFAT